MDLMFVVFLVGYGADRRAPCRSRDSAGARATVIDWGELVQVHDDRAIFQGRIDELPVIDIHSL